MKQLFIITVVYKLWDTFNKSIIVDRPRPALSLRGHYRPTKGLLYAARPLAEPARAVIWPIANHVRNYSCMKIKRLPDALSDSL